MHDSLHIIMPVKDALETTREAIDCLYRSDDRNWTFTLYDDFSTEENSAEIDALAAQYGFTVVHWKDRTDHPSPNYRLTLIDAQKQALEAGADLLIIESDVLVREDTIGKMRRASQSPSKGDGKDSECDRGEKKKTNHPIGMIAAVTHDAEGKVNFPYLYAKRWKQETIETKKRFSFCCTLLTLELLRALPFEGLDATKNWFDVTISHRSAALGMRNLLLMQVPVLHKPHSSRPWKQLKYTHPLRYYWEKLILRRDKI